jgi:hypothetical protein
MRQELSVYTRQELKAYICARAKRIYAPGAESIAKRWPKTFLSFTVLFPLVKITFSRSQGMNHTGFEDGQRKCALHMSQMRATCVTNARYICHRCALNTIRRVILLRSIKHSCSQSLVSKDRCQNKTGWSLVGLAITIYIYILGILAGKSPNIRSYTVYIHGIFGREITKYTVYMYGSGQP